MSGQKKYQVRPVLQAFREIGVCVPSTLRRVGLTEDLVKRQNFQFDAKTCRRIFVAAAEEFSGPDFGLQVALQYSKIPYGPVFFAFISSPDIGAAIKAIAKYKPQVSPLGIVAEHDEIGMKITMCEMTSDFPASSSMALVEFAYIVELSRNCADGFLKVKQISLRDSGAAHDAYKRFFACPILEGPIDAIWFGSEDLTIPLHSKNQEIGAVCRKQLDDLYFPNLDQQDLCEQVRQALKEDLLSGRVGAQNVAKKMGLSVRTLTRRLKENGISFTEIQSDLQRHHAVELLSNMSVSISEVAFRVGFKEVASFYRAFKKWYGITPAQMRETWKQEQKRVF